MFELINSPILRSFRRAFGPGTLATGADGGAAPFPLGPTFIPNGVGSPFSKAPFIKLVPDAEKSGIEKPGSIELMNQAMSQERGEVPMAEVKLPSPFNSAKSHISDEVEQDAAVGSVPSVTVALGSAQEQSSQKEPSSDPLVKGLSQLFRRAGQPPTASTQLSSPGARRLEEQRATRQAVEDFGRIEHDAEQKTLRAESRREQFARFRPEIDQIAAADQSDRSALRQELKGKLIEAEANGSLQSSVHSELVREIDAAGEPRLAVGAGKDGLLSDHQLGRLSDQELNELEQSEKESLRLLNGLVTGGFVAGAASVGEAAAAEGEARRNEKSAKTGRESAIPSGSNSFAARLLRKAGPLGFASELANIAKGLTNERLEQIETERDRRKNSGGAKSR